MSRAAAGRAAALAAILLLAGAAACESDDPLQSVIGPATFAFDFNAGTQGWSADFVDFPPELEDSIEFVSDHRPLPPPLDANRRALYHRGMNVSDDLFMYYKRRVDGLVPGATYRVGFTIGFATTIASGCFGGLSLYLKAGAVQDEPHRVIGTAEGWVRLSADKGFQTDTGEDVVLLGEMRSTTPGCPEDEFGPGELGEGAGTMTVTADDNGAVWLFFGEESVFEIAHSVYYTAFEARFEPVQ